MDFLVLGTLEARDLGRPLVIGAPRTRSVLALLLTQPNALVSVDRLVDELWPEQAPRAARELVHGYLSRLRRALHAGSAADRLVTRKPGYLLRVEDHELDRCRFERLLADARAHAEAGQLDQSLARYRDAGQLWRGTPFLDVPATATITAAVTSLTELRLTSLAEQYEVALQLGGGADLVAELTDLVTAYPLRERLVGQLMRALHHAGRTADALDLYHRTSQRLADELGIRPGRQLRQCQLSILREETDPVAVNRPAPPVRPAQLPADLPTFVGREPDLAYLLAGDPDPGRAGNLTVIDGMAGVGKTALAVRWAHGVRDRFPDGQLYVNLRGYAAGVPVRPIEA
ncbi:MAG: AfsR/SARP family transcriptional regulator, partial [Natronosporangium sp.]